MKQYTYDEVLQASLEYFNNDQLAATTWINKYAKRDKDNNLVELTPDDMHKRLAKAFFDIEQKYIYNTNTLNNLKLSEYGYNRTQLTEEQIYNYFKNFKYIIPAGSVMSGIDNYAPVSLSNCWVIKGPDDTLEDIFRVCNEQSQLMKRRGGVGFDISNLRPYGAYVNNSAKSSTGAASFMDLFSHVTNTIAQNGRRGALMLSINIKHPDSQFFIEKKQDLTKVTGANVSVAITDEFMKAVINDDDYLQTWPNNIVINEHLTEKTNNISIKDLEYNKLYPMIYGENEFVSNTKMGYMKKVRAKELWNILIHCAWNTAEPGILFQDKHHNYSPDGVYESFKGSCTNPCGEIYMHEDSCRLIHINLTSFVKDGKLDEELLYKITYEAMRLADDLVDLEEIAINKILNKIEKDGDKNNSEYNLYTRLLKHSLEGRRCGLGFTGLADTVALLNYKYDSEESLNIINKILKIMFIAELDSNIDMAITRGTFPAYDKKLEENGNLWYDTIKKELPELYTKLMKYGRRNISQNTVAPTGTVSLMAQCSSGIEPIFMPYYTRRVKCMKPTDRIDFIDSVGEKYTEYITVHPGLFKWANNNNLVNENMNVKQWQQIYEKSPWFKSTANDIDWEKRVKLQAIVQHYISHSISSTVNLPNEVTEEEVSNIYMKAWENGLKGITVYRDGCRAGVMVSTDQKKEEPKKPIVNDAKRRPKSLPCKVFRFTNKGEKWVGVVGILDDEPYEIFSGLQENLAIPAWVNEAEIVRNKEDGHSRYDICYLDKDGYKVCIQGLSRIFNPEYWNYGKLISGLLRHHMEIKYIIKVISTLKLDDSINAWKNGIIRTLQKFEKTKDEPVKGETCPECGGELIREAGCIHCKECGWSRCE